MGKESRIGLLCAGLIALLVLSSSVARAASHPTAVRPIEATPTASAPSATQHFEGGHTGTEFESQTALCPFLDHRLYETFTLTDSSTWSFQAHYCGTIDAHGVWRGVGKFVITTGTGSTLSGAFTDAAHLPSLGVPYELDVNGGTGVFAEASGSCMLDDHLSAVAPGIQHQEGIFVCDLGHRR